MSTGLNRRDFIRGSAAAGLALTVAPHVAAGKDDGKVRLGFIGVGGQGTNLLKLAIKLKNVAIPAICDITRKNLQRAQGLVEESGRKKPEGYSEHEESFRDLVTRDDLDGVVIATPWEWHIQMSIAVMRAGKYAATEVGPANSVEECWELVEAFEETGMPCMLLENHCYDRWNMAILRMVREGIFGELLHCQCGYEHDLRGRIVRGKGSGPRVKGEGDYRTDHNRSRNGDLYPTHGIGPVANCLNIDRGNRFVHLTSTATKSRGLHEWAVANLGNDHPNAEINWAMGDIVTTVIKCQNGETVIINFDTRSPRPYSNMRRVQGTNGIWLQDGDATSLAKSTIYIEGRSPHHQWESFDAYQEEFEHPLWRKYLQEGVVSGHRGGGYLKIRAFVECVKRKTPTPIDVYDAATWMVISPLSEQSIALGSESVLFPDFTRGKWIHNKPVFGLNDQF